MNPQSDGYFTTALESNSQYATDSPTRAMVPPRIMTGRKLGWSLATVIVAAYIVYFFSLRTFPFQDFPNHQARAVVIADLLFHHGARFGSTFALTLSAVPYLLHDLILACCVELFGIHAGGAVFITFIFLSLPCALLYYMHATGLAPRARPFVVFISLYLATDWFFLMAFTAFRLGLALIIVSLALAEKLRREWSPATFGGYVGVVAVGYFTHLAAPVFLLGALTVSAAIQLLCRNTTVRRELYLLLPVVALLGIHVIAHHDSTAPLRFSYEWGSWHQKIKNLLFEFRRFGGRPELAMMVLFALCLLWPVRAFLRLRSFSKPAVLQALAVSAAFACLFFVMPHEYADSTYLDVRALSMTSLMLIVACLNLPDDSSSGRSFDKFPVLALAALLATCNLAYILKHVGKSDTVLANYRRLADSVPRGATVLPIHTRSKEGELVPLLHAGSFLVMDREAVMPYLFSGNEGDPMTYFRYRNRPYAPEEDWYREQVAWDAAGERTYHVEGRSYTWRFAYSMRDEEWKMMSFIPVNWNRIACAYDFLLVTEPLDTTIIRIPTTTVRENEAGVLLSVDKQACRPDDAQRGARLSSAAKFR